MTFGDPPRTNQLKLRPESALPDGLEIAAHNLGERTEAAVQHDPELMWLMLLDAYGEIERLRGERPVVSFQVGPNGQMPTRAHHGDAGYDLYVSDDAWIEPGEFVDIPCDVRMALPPNAWAQIVGRSSTLRQRGLMVNPGVIDQGYRGELYAGVWNLGQKQVMVRKGERVAQLILMPLTAGQVTVRQVETLERGDRGDNGFGSTGA